MKNLIVFLLFIVFCCSVYAQEKSMAELNPEFEGRLIQALKSKNDNTLAVTTYRRPIAFFHFSDVHGDKETLQRCVDFLKIYRKYFDDAVCTGDLTSTCFFDDFSFWGQVEGAERILLTIGNHDMLYSKDWDWSKIPPEKEAYEKFFAPFIKNWNVNYEPGKTYYYKDYKEKGYKLVCIDGYLRTEEEEEQFVWFKKTIQNAKDNNLAVVILYHGNLSNEKTVNIKCNWTDPDYPDIEGKSYLDKYQNVVDEFINNQGEFICWLGGHTHWDYVGYNVNHPKQLNICIDSAHKGQGQNWDDINRSEDPKFADLCNAFVADRHSHTIRLIRIGANLSSYLQPRNTFCIDYKTFEIISQY